MGFNLFFDFAALAVLAFLVFSIILKRQVIGLSNKLYLVVISCTIVGTILDILASLAELPITVLFVLNTFFVFFRAMTALSLFLYACNLGNVYYRLKRNRWVYVLLFLPLLVLTGFLIANFFNKQVFDYLPGPAYQRGPLMTVAYVVGYLYLGAGLVIILISRKYHSPAQIIALVGAFMLQVGSSVFQYFVGDVLIEMFVASITILTLSIFIESPENFVDYKTRNLNYRSFTMEMRRRFDLKESFSVFFIHVTNSSSLYGLFPHKQALEFNRACSAAVQEKARRIDHSALVYYLGGATFAYTFSDRSRDEEIQQLITKEFSTPMTHNNITFLFEAKTCLVHCPEDCHDVTALIGFSTTFFDLTDKSHLDLAPYRKNGGNILFELDHILERAIAEKSFSVFYQGIYSLPKKRFISAEALVRLNDPVFGLIMPSLMIPYAEGHGKIAAISRIVMEKAFAFFVEHLRGKLEYVEINLSPPQLLDPRFVEKVNELAERFGIKPSEVVFEVTENTVTGENAVLDDNLKALQEQGYRLAIDDFGTGYSNLSRLLQLNLSILKFDRTMTHLLAHDDQDDFFLGLFAIFRHRKITLLFEGVEDQKTAEKLERMKADHIQGYYYSKTIPEEALLDLISDQKYG